MIIRSCFRFFVLWPGLCLHALLRKAQSIYSGITPPLKNKTNRHTLHDFLYDHAQVIPDNVLDRCWNKFILLVSLVITLNVLYGLLFCFLFSDSGGSGVYWSIFVVLSLFLINLTNDSVLHIEAHAKGGLILKKVKNKSLTLTLIYHLDILRRYVVWPLMFWLPYHYQLTHRFVHHKENNSISDPQSTLRYDQTSLFSLINATTWYGLFLKVIPLDYFRYFQSVSQKLLTVYRRTYLMGIAVFVVFSLLFPWLAAVALCSVILSGLENYLKARVKHGLHDSTKPYVKDACCSSPIAVGHQLNHQYVHPLLGQENAQNFWFLWEKNANLYTIFISSKAKTFYEEHWLYVCAMLWQKKLRVMRAFINTQSRKGDAEFSKHVRGIQILERKSFLIKLDARLSKMAGLIIEKIYMCFMSKHINSFIKNREQSDFFSRRNYHFSLFLIKDGKNPSGLY